MQLTIRCVLRVSIKFTSVLKIEETTPLEPGEKEAKYYAAGIGLLKDGPMKLVRHGFTKK